MLSGPVGTLLVALAVVIALVFWLRRDQRYPGPRLEVKGDGIDHEALEAAEREVRELEANQRPEGGFEGEDWGPGTPRPPVRL